MTETRTAKPKSIQFMGLTSAEQPLVTLTQSLIGEHQQVEQKLSGLAVEIGHALVDLRTISKKDGNKYSVILPGKTEPENIGRFDAVINSFGLARATAYRYIRAYENHLKATNPVPAAVIQMVTSNGVLDPTTEVAQEVLADAFLAAGQPSNPTPLQCMAIVADACKRAEEAPSNNLEDFKKLLSKAISFAREHNLSSEVIHSSLESEIAASFGMPESRVTREKAPIYRQGENS